MKKDFQENYNLYSKAMADTSSNHGGLVIRERSDTALAYSRRFNNISDNISIKSDYGLRDYDSYRPSDTYPQDMEGIISECMYAYDNEPIIHHIIDLMSDFGSQGIRVICADKRQEKFGQEYGEFMELPEFANRFLNTLYRCGTTVVKRTDGKVPLKVRKKWGSTVASNYMSRRNIPTGQDPNIEIDVVEESPNKATIPLKWTIHDPRSIVMIGGILSTFTGKPLFGLRINNRLRTELSELPRLIQKGGDYEYFMNLIPQYVFDAINTNAEFFPLDQSKTYAYYYKKDDWELWGKPIIRPILRELKIYNKLKLSDMSALDGAISAVRLWTLGSLEHEIIPEQGALSKFRDVLAQGIGGGTMDIVWGPEVTFKESQSNLYEFLRPEKYTQTISDIYSGMGIPSGLTGSANSDSMTNKFTGLKILIERLKYGRSVLLKFLNEQFRLVQEAMGFTHKFKIVFDQMVLSDEAAEKKLLIELHDRDIITTETLRFAFDIDEQDIEDIKIKRESRKRGVSMPYKAGPYHNGNIDSEYKKIMLQNKSAAPSELGVQLLPLKPEEKNRIDLSGGKNGKELKKYKPTGSPSNGRPLNSKDTTKRKQKRVLPRGASGNFKDLFSFAEKSRNSIDEIVTPLYLNLVNKKNIRSLTNEETESLENMKFYILTSLKPYQELNEEVIASISKEETFDDEINNIFKDLVYNHIDEYGRSPTVTEKRKLQCHAYASVYKQNN